jgi:D-alanyl-D-alanine carboxypeptidase (penicillin-binding protein 5/6)
MYSTPRDITKLALALLKHPEALKYTSTKVRPFRTDALEPFIMRNRNRLVSNFEGCDGLKTGFFYAAGFSIAATAVNDKGRAIAVIFGSSYSKVRDEKASELLSAGLTEIAAKPPPPPAPEVAVATALRDRPFIWGNKYIFVIGLACGIFAMRNFKT